MSALYQAFCQRLSAASSVGELKNCLEFAAVGMGFEYFLFCGYEYDCFTQKRADIICNFPDTFFSDEIMDLGIENDPALLACKLTAAPVVWSKALFSKDPAFRRAAEAAKLSVGWAMTVMHTPRSLAFLEFARSKGVLSHEEQSLKLATFRAIADAFEHRRADLARDSAHEAMLATGEEPTKPCPLSARELEILRWTADGKIADEIGIILNISPRTVSFHLTNIMQILSVPNKTAAVSRAQMMTWLY